MQISNFSVPSTHRLQKISKVSSRQRITQTIINLCPSCKGVKIAICSDCQGSGLLNFGGYHVKNHVQIDKITNESNRKWTAIQRTFGWRHFQVTGKKKEGKVTYICMQSVCDSTKSFWLNSKELKDRKVWAKGWLQTDLIEKLENRGAECKTCLGIGQLACKQCKDGFIDLEL
eukprot:TRINITY_DN973_c0_g1_i4.p1 TRINITY_DN973_c0_g1~~TRINITY_DN973_c0_g1_i4.p1  ORF type:complete len:173 (-),score=8.04 TRINITY_DN973_c0_g1_i4:1-519(-)